METKEDSRFLPHIQNLTSKDFCHPINISWDQKKMKLEIYILQTSHLERMLLVLNVVVPLRYQHFPNVLLVLKIIEIYGFEGHGIVFCLHCNF